jgi:hypothetical protein
MNALQLADILELPVEERVKLAQAIWDSVSELPLPPLRTREGGAEQTPRGVSPESAGRLSLA